MMDKQTDKIGGIILAGGKSSRFGSDKGLTNFHGKPLVQYSVDLLQEVAAEICIVSGNPEYKRFNYPVYSDIISGYGPLAGILTGLTYSKNEYNFVLSCDTPFVNLDLLLYLKLHIHKKWIAVPVNPAGLFEPLCAIYSKNCIAVIQKMIENNDHKVLNLFAKVDTAVLKISDELPFYQENLFANINTLTDLSNVYDNR